MQAPDFTVTKPVSPHHSENLTDTHSGFSLANSIRIASGLSIFALLAIVAASLATWSVNDPSISHATDEPAQNIFGFFGASVADLLMQFWGISTLISVIPIGILAWRMVFGQPITRIRLRALSWFAGSLLAAASIGSLPQFSSWPLPNGMGGIIGDAILQIPAWIFGSFPSGIWALVSFVIFAVLALYVLAISAQIAFVDKSRTKSASDEQFDPSVDTIGHEEEKVPGLIIGMIAHMLLVLRYQLHRLWVRIGIWKSAYTKALAVKRQKLEAEEIGLPVEQLEPSFSMSAEASPSLHIEPQFTNGIQTTLNQAAPSFDIPEFRTPAFGVPEQGQPITPMSTHGRVQAPPAPVKQSTRIQREAQPNLPMGAEFELPSVHFLTNPPAKVQSAHLTNEALEQNARMLESVLEDFGVKGQIINVRPGPVVTLYELEPAPGIKSSRVIGLADDIARSMSAVSARVAVVPGRNAIGIELPNASRETVYLQELIASQDYEKTKASLPLGLGKTIGGEPVVTDLAKTPHLLVAGTTGSGKSVSVNTMILSLLYHHNSDQCKMIMIDPKMLELSVYDGIPHLLTPVVTDPKKAVVALKWTVREMEERYKKMSKLGVRNITGYNSRVAEAKKSGEPLSRTIQTGYDSQTGEAIYEVEDLNFEHMPFIVVIIDEMADLMIVAGKEIEGAVQRLAQMARAAGIHVIMATQRPSVDVITGTIKANFPSRISFQVTSKIDSRTILGEQGAEQLLGMGDMLFMAGGGKVQRVHGAFVGDDEVEQIVAHLKSQGVPQYLEDITVDEEEDATSGGADNTGNLAQSEDPYDQAVAIVLRDGKASTSYVQRRLGIGYNRAASIIERMEEEGIIGPANHAGKREILVPTENEEQVF